MQPQQPVAVTPEISGDPLQNFVADSQEICCENPRNMLHGSQETHCGNPLNRLRAPRKQAEGPSSDVADTLQTSCGCAPEMLRKPPKPFQNKEEGRLQNAKCTPREGGGNPHFSFPLGRLSEYSQTRCGWLPDWQRRSGRKEGG